MAIPAAFVTDGKYQISPEIFEETFTPDLDLSTFDVTHSDAVPVHYMNRRLERKYQFCENMSLSQRMCQMANRAFEMTCHTDDMMPPEDIFRPDDPRRLR
jgi:hypothetical protein